jgi:hypothetical protein
MTSALRGSGSDHGHDFSVNESPSYTGLIQFDYGRRACKTRQDLGRSAVEAPAASAF